mmetsp:Transcript_5824/g.16804  ORF Transcript_5824/g.16804 Transcript_5824/m.16804 type:complete len:373 (+) Transcript_5824:888-2006(+)
MQYGVPHHRLVLAGLSPNGHGDSFWECPRVLIEGTVKERLQGRVAVRLHAEGYVDGRLFRQRRRGRPGVFAGRPANELVMPDGAGVVRESPRNVQGVSGPQQEVLVPRRGVGAQVILGRPADHVGGGEVDRGLRRDAPELRPRYLHDHDVHPVPVRLERVIRLPLCNPRAVWTIFSLLTSTFPAPPRRRGRKVHVRRRRRRSHILPQHFRELPHLAIFPLRRVHHDAVSSLLRRPSDRIGVQRLSRERPPPLSDAVGVGDALDHLIIFAVAKCGQRRGRQEGVDLGRAEGGGMDETDASSDGLRFGLGAVVGEGRDFPPVEGRRHGGASSPRCVIPSTRRLGFVPVRRGRSAFSPFLPVVESTNAAAVGGGQ